MSQQNLDAKISAAWKAQRSGQYQAAIEQFLALAQEAPDNLDIYWGLGLSYRNAGAKDQALQSFQKVKDLVAAQVENEGSERGRYFMLNQMVTQQIEQIEQFLRK